MALVRPRLTDFYGISAAQVDIDFAIPFLTEDIPLYVDPFLLWRSPSQQDQALHTALLHCFNHQGWLARKEKSDVAIANLIQASECNEVGLGLSETRHGRRINEKCAEDILRVFSTIPHYRENGFAHIEELQLFVDGISKDRISDVSCTFLKSFLVDYTMENCLKWNIPVSQVTLDSLYNYSQYKFIHDVKVSLPISPENGEPIILVPKRWMRFVPWINYDDYFASSCPRDDVVQTVGAADRVSVLLYNRDNIGAVNEYVKIKEKTADQCVFDPLFTQIPVTSAQRAMSRIKKISSGSDHSAHKQYEDSTAQLLASLLYPHLDFADTQVRTESGVHIRDLIFYNNRSIDFLEDILNSFKSRQLVFEMKNVGRVEGEHINQLNRYLNNEFGSFGVIVCRNPFPNNVRKNTVDLWSGQRRCIIDLCDADLEMMVEVYDSKQRMPIEVLKKKYVEFLRLCPS